ncbi:MAG TPA: proline hydroxylase, partial [Rhodospirillaceae bacterium]|nr:proline hydroxylase [Rhodospirillaceae bacterium]
MTEIIDYEALNGRLAADQTAFQSADPFPYVVIDEFLRPESADALLGEFGQPPRDGGKWNQYTHYNERKSGLTRMDAMGAATRAVIDELSSQEFLDWLSGLSGIEDLLADPDLDGGGLHEIKPGGFLNIHTDFLSHTKRPHWRRQLNLLIYLNKEWQADWHGELELWDGGMEAQAAAIEPVFNRCVIFHTTEKSFHGHPVPLACPDDVTRKSLALYYFSDAGAPLKLTPTHYRAKPEESGFKHALVAVDRWMVRGYS